MTFDPSRVANLVFVWVLVKATGDRTTRTRVDLFWLPWEPVAGSSDQTAVSTSGCRLIGIASLPQTSTTPASS